MPTHPYNKTSPEVRILLPMVKKAIRFTGFKIDYSTDLWLACSCGDKYAWFKIDGASIVVCTDSSAWLPSELKGLRIPLADPELSRKITKFIVDNHIFLIRYRRFIIPILIFYAYDFLASICRGINRLLAPP